MELPEDHPLYSEALAATQLADERLESSTRSDYNGSLRRFAEFCEQEGYPNPLEHRFQELPSVLAAYIGKISRSNSTQWPAEKLRAALSWHYAKPAMVKGGHPVDRWIVERQDDGGYEARGNPAKATMISQITTGLSKVKKRVRVPVRSSPISLSKLTTMINYLQKDTVFNELMCVWFMAVGSLCFYGMCRINEVLQMKRGDIQLGLERVSSINPSVTVRYGCFPIRDRKTDHDPQGSRTYNLHFLPKDEKTAEALTYVQRWIEFASDSLNHSWSRDEFVFPSLTRVPRASVKRSRPKAAITLSGESFKRVGVKWGAAMTENNFIQILNIVAGASNINQSLLGDDIWFTSHCFRRGGAQYRFMFAPEKRRWSLKMVKWWAGWAQKERNETVLRYLLDDVLDREESQLGDSLAPDVINHTKEMFIDASRLHESSVTNRLASVEGKANNSVTTSDQVPMTKDCLKSLLREVLAEVAVNGGNDFPRSQVSPKRRYRQPLR